MLRSETITSGSIFLSCKSAPKPSSAAVTSYPADINSTATLSRTLGSSSTTSTSRFEGVAIGTPLCGLQAQHHVRAVWHPDLRSEERRVGKEGSYQGWTCR